MLNFVNDKGNFVKTLKNKIKHIWWASERVHPPGYGLR